MPSACARRTVRAAPRIVHESRTAGRGVRKLLRQRILVLDGAMGTMIQGHSLDEAGFRGERFRDWAL